MKTMIAFLIAFSLVVCKTPQQAPPVPPQELLLSVELQDVIVHHMRFQVSVTPGKPFAIEAHSGTVECVISGTVPSPVNGVYHFPIRIDESDGPKDSMKGTQVVDLTLNKGFSGGPGSSFVYMRTIKLTDPAAHA